MDEPCSRKLDILWNTDDKQKNRDTEDGASAGAKEWSKNWRVYGNEVRVCNEVDNPIDPPNSTQNLWIYELVWVELG